jgi:hypothetical protein
MAGQPRHCRKPTVACSGCSIVTNVDPRLMVSSWHHKRTAETWGNVNDTSGQEVERDLLYLSAFSSS